MSNPSLLNKNVKSYTGKEVRQILYFWRQFENVACLGHLRISYHVSKVTSQPSFDIFMYVHHPEYSTQIDPTHIYYKSSQTTFIDSTHLCHLLAPCYLSQIYYISTIPSLLTG